VYVTSISPGELQRQEKRLGGSLLSGYRSMAR
jgi:hypothetical protein